MMIFHVDGKLDLTIMCHEYGVVKVIEKYLNEMFSFLLVPFISLWMPHVMNRITNGIYHFFLNLEVMISIN